jgi:hypothetical protein
VRVDVIIGISAFKSWFIWAKFRPLAVLAMLANGPTREAQKE